MHGLELTTGKIAEIDPYPGKKMFIMDFVGTRDGIEPPTQVFSVIANQLTPVYHN